MIELTKILLEYLNKRRFVFLLFMIFPCCNQSFANNAAVDSLKSFVDTSKADENKVNALYELFTNLVYSQIDEAEEYAKQGLILSFQINYFNGKIIGLGHLGSCAMLKGDYVLSLEYYLQALELAEKKGDRIKKAQIIGNIGDIYVKQKRFEEALESYNEAINIKNIEGKENTTLFNYRGLGDVYFNLQKYDLALENYKKAIEIAKLTNNLMFQATCNNNIAAIYYKQKNYQKALDGYKYALNVFLENNYELAIIGSYHNIAMCYREIGKYDEATEVFFKSLEIAQKINSKENIKQAYSGLEKTYKLKGEIDKAYYYQGLYSDYKDSVINENVQRQLNEIEKKYEAEKKDQEIIELKLEKEVIKAKSSFQKTLLFLSIGMFGLLILVILLYLKQRKAKEFKRRMDLEQKALRTQMNPHFIFNSLNNIQLMFAEGNNDLVNDYISDFGQLLRIVLENSGKPSISLQDELDTLRLYLDLEIMRTEGFIEYEIKIDSNIDKLNIFVPPLIIQPFVENAIWHGILPGKEKGKIIIEIIKQSDSGLICVITDNGIGIEKSEKLKEPSEHKSRGMQITQERLGLINSVKAEELESGGTKITLIIPLSK